MDGVPLRVSRAHLLTAVAAVLFASGSAAQRLGLFFDTDGTQCNAAIEPFGPAVQAYVVVYPPPDSLISGVAFRLEMPPAIHVTTGSVFYPRNLVAEALGEPVGGVDVHFQACRKQVGPLMIAQFRLEDRNLGGFVRNDLRIKLVGFSPDSVAAVEPQIRLCDPENPITGDGGRFPAPSVDAVFNCTERCYCTTAVRRTTFAAVKSLYREP